MSIFYGIKFTSLFLIILLLVLMRSNPYLTESRRKYYSFLVSSALLSVIFLVFIPLIWQRLIYLRKVSFLMFFFNDMILLIILTLIVLCLRDTEMKVLVNMGVYKNIDTMNDKELFAEYDKLLLSAKKMRRIIRGKEKREARKREAIISGHLGRSSMGN